jgi:hypothetical protein
VQPLPIVILLYELFDDGPQIFQVVVFVSVDFFPLQRLDEAFATGIYHSGSPVGSCSKSCGTSRLIRSVKRETGMGLQSCADPFGLNGADPLAASFCQSAICRIDECSENYCNFTSLP